MCPREAEKKNTNVYEDLPLFAIEEKFNKTEGGKQLGCIMALSAIYPHMQFFEIR